MEHCTIISTKIKDTRRLTELGCPDCIHKIRQNFAAIVVDAASPSAAASHHCTAGTHHKHNVSSIQTDFRF